jgi:site-specific DNA recombinase
MVTTLNTPTAEASTIRAALYARVSSEQQAQQGTIASQLADLRQRIETDGLTLDEELCFIDDGYVGSTLVRPALDRLRDVAYAGGFDRLYVHSPDRLARKYAWQMLLVEELQRSGVELIFLNRMIGVSPEEDLLLQMQGMIAEYERTKIMERCRRGKRHAARRGSINVLGGAPYGYRYIGKHEGGGQAHYQVKLDEARVVQQVFEWVGRDRLSIREVGRRLLAEGVPSAKGKRWCSETIGKMLKNPAYKGQAVFGKTRTTERRQQLRPGRGRPEHPRQPHSRCAGNPNDQIAIPVPAIVSEELFDAVAEQLVENRKRLRQQTNASYLLQGLMECGCCGYAWYGHGLTRFRRKQKALYPYYRCGGRDGYRFGGKPVCSNKPLRLDRLDAAVWADVCAVIQNPEQMRQEFERRLNADDSAEVNLPQTQKQIAAVKRSISRLIDAYEDGLLDKDEFEPRLQQARQRLDRLQQDAAAAADHDNQQAELRLVLGHIDQFAEQVRAGLDESDFDARRQIIRALVKVVKIEEDHVRIIYRISPRPFADGRSGGPIPQHCPRRVRIDPARDQDQGRGQQVREGRAWQVRPRRQVEEGSVIHATAPSTAQRGVPCARRSP